MSIFYSHTLLYYDQNDSKLLSHNEEEKRNLLLQFVQQDMFLLKKLRKCLCIFMNQKAEEKLEESGNAIAIT